MSRVYILLGFSGGTSGKESVCSCRMCKRSGFDPWVRKMKWIRSLGQEDPLEKGIAIHSSTLAWRIPRREEPCRLQSMGSQRVRHS